MADKTKIEWADATWNPISGCSPVSEGCAHCYAARIAQRFPEKFGDFRGGVKFHEERLTQPLHWKRPRRIFVCSMGDLFHENVKAGWIWQVFNVMRGTPQHRYLILTKRPQNVLPKLERMKKDLGNLPEQLYSIPDNVWLGISAENQRRLEERMYELAKLVIEKPFLKGRLFVSAEPLLGPLNMQRAFDEAMALLGDEPPFFEWGVLIDWVIAGGETGKGWRYADYQWFDSLERQCREIGVPFFFKQPPGGWSWALKYEAGYWAVYPREFPEDLQLEEASDEG